ncbi:hypothetical protein IA539_10030 [Gordonia sp. zg691]|uniref:hypothetical protein n=1 Tax=Gordonia jinghuaiqii TaxID=2758710 RepID=UPI0016622B33|nr:hypothetical protein [Gordonia jinghuaiqii]MBD0861547.1 hypothetical protein [Gordonia jinghuaiqii]
MTGAAIVLLVLTALLPPMWVPVDRAVRDRSPATVVRRVRAAGAVGLLALASATALTAAAAGPATGFLGSAAPVIAAVAAVTGGGPVVRAVLAAGGVGTGPNPAPNPDPAPTGTPADVGPLRGGRVIGYLERLAVVTTLMAGWPEGLAIILAVKSLARYPELRAPHASEQFIMGTFASVLWAVGLAGVDHLITH